MISMNLADEVEGFVLCYKDILTCSRVSTFPLWLSYWEDLPSIAPIFEQREAVGEMAGALWGGLLSLHWKPSGELSLPVILDLMHLSQAPGDLGQHIIRRCPGPYHLGSFAYVNIMHGAHLFFFFCWGQLKVRDTNFYSAVIQILQSQHNP